MANIVNQYGQVKVGVRQRIAEAASTLWNSIYSVFNADSAGSSSLKTSLFAAYNGESNANDSFGSNNGTAQGGLTYTTGKIGNAFNFNGTNAYVSLPNNSLNLTGDFSYSAWVYFRDVPSGERWIVTTTNGNAISTDFGVSFGILSGQLALGVYANTDSSVWKSNGVLAPSTWYHVTVTKKLSNAPKFYINGTLQTTSLLAGTNTLNPIYTSGTYPNSLATIGAYRYNSGSSIYGYSNANIDAVNIWQKELTQSEITELYNSGNGAQYITDNFYKPTANDALNTYNGTAQGGLTYGVGKVGTAFQSNGTNSYISLPDNSLNFTGDFSISTWVYVTGLGTWQEVISNYFNTAMTQSGWDISISPVGVLNFSTYRSNSIYQALTYNMSSYLNQWIHLVVTRKPTVSNGHKIYINGTLVAQQTGMDPVYNSTQWCNINSLKYNGGVSYHLLSGSKIDALNIWNKELSASEITELYNSGNGKQYTI